MSDDLPEIQRQLDALYLKAVAAPVQRRPQLIAAALGVIHAAAAADAQLERAFGHLIEREPLPQPLPSGPPPLPHEVHAPLPAANPALAEALKREGW